MTRQGTHCPKCGKEQLFGTYCYEDGAALVPRECTGCGHSTLNHYTFCPECGREVSPKRKETANVGN